MDHKFINKAMFGNCNKLKLEHMNLKICVKRPLYFIVY